MYTLQPWMIRIETGLNKALLSPEEKKKYFFKMNADGLLRGNYESRMQGYATGINNGFMSVNDVRELENMDLLSDEEGGNIHMVNGTMQKLSEVGSAYQKAEPSGKSDKDDTENKTKEPKGSRR